MRQSIIYRATEDYCGRMNKRQSKRACMYVKRGAHIKARNESAMVCVAYRLTDDPAEKKLFEEGLCRTSEWILGRNPLRLALSTHLTDRPIPAVYKIGRNDGFEGQTPGAAPFMATKEWSRNCETSRCWKYYEDRTYPGNGFSSWPRGEWYFATRDCVPYGEMTPQETLTGRAVLFATMYAIYKKQGATGASDRGTGPRPGSGMDASPLFGLIEKAGALHLSFASREARIVSLVTPSGQIVSTHAIDGARHCVIPVAHLAPGMYLCKVKSRQGTRVREWVGGY
jgi:hypothetical protein